MHYNAQTVLHFLGYSYIMDLINAQKMKHFKSTLQPLVFLFLSSPPHTHTHTHARTVNITS